MLGNAISVGSRGLIVDSELVVDTEKESEDLSKHEERQYPRIRTNLIGRYMLAGRQEFECVIVNVAVGGIAVSGPQAGAISEPVIAYIDRVGRVQGNIVRLIDGGFALKLTATKRAAEKLAVRLGAIEAENVRERAAEERREEMRVEPDDKVAYFSLTLGEGAECEVLDISRSGAEVKTRERPPIGALVSLGKLSGTVVRHTELGVGIKFEDWQENVSLTERLEDIRNTKTANG